MTEPVATPAKNQRKLLGRVTSNKMQKTVVVRTRKGVRRADGSLQREFLALQNRLRKTVVFVTHDLREALLLGTRIAMMEAGRLVTAQTPAYFVQSTEPMVAAYVHAFGTDLKRGAS